MKGIVLAGGQGSRLRPVTAVINKHLLPVYDQPMIHYPLRALVEAGIDRVLVVTGAEHAEAFARVLGDGLALGLRELAFAYQPSSAGVADALRRGRTFAGEEPVCVLLGDNLLGASLRPFVQRLAEQGAGARLLLTPVAEGRDLGMMRMDEAGQPARIVEKPTPPGAETGAGAAMAGLAVVGVYGYDAGVFARCDQLAPGPRGELEISDLNNLYLQRGEAVCDLLEGWWVDAGTFANLHRAGELVRQGPNGRIRQAVWTAEGPKFLGLPGAGLPGAGVGR